jgi:hypothetical protein
VAGEPCGQRSRAGRDPPTRTPRFRTRAKSISVPPGRLVSAEVAGIVCRQCWRVNRSAVRNIHFRGTSRRRQRQMPLFSARPLTRFVVLCRLGSPFPSGMPDQQLRLRRSRNRTICDRIDPSVCARNTDGVIIGSELGEAGDARGSGQLFWSRRRAWDGHGGQRGGPVALSLVRQAEAWRSTLGEHGEEEAP